MRPFRLLGDSELPFYSVLVPLYGEQRVVADLVAALARLDYAHDRIEILFLLEKSDAETAATLRPLLQRGMRIVTVPAGEPRTKPRALNFGLQQARGDLVTIYDGEDRPDPLQLRLAASCFSEAPPELAVLQAHLAVDHVDRGFLVRQFALEYAALFDRLLPWLADSGRPIPLGGTSNHFRREALDAMQGWDPYNVTEDADIGIRLCRHGYRLAMLDSTTWEEAPTNWRAWHGQRTRWHKGWLQTLLVAFRRPWALARELDRPALVVVLIYVVSFVFTLLAHLLFAVLIPLYAFGLLELPFSGTFLGDCLIVLIVSTLAIGYGGSVTAMLSAGQRRNIPIGARDVLGLPFYWLLQSLAFLAAVIDLVRRPHHWCKTEHGVAKRPAIAPTRAMSKGTRS